jgi:hypothetical protein
MVSLRVSCSGFFCSLFAYTRPVFIFTVEEFHYSLKTKSQLKLFFFNLNFIKN